MTTLLENHSLYSLFKLHWFAIILVIIYLFIRKVVHSPLKMVTRNMKTYFVIATLLLFFIKVTPIDVLANHYLFSAHLLQLSFVFFIIIPLYMLSIPSSVFRQWIWNHRMKFIVKLLSHPWISFIAFNGGLTIYLMPPVFTFFQQYYLLHVIVQTLLIIFSIFMWWVIIQPIPEMNVLNPIIRALYIFLASLALMPIGFFLVLVQKVNLPIYAAVEGLIFPVLTTIYDQQLAGGILKITQMFSYAFALLFIMLQWGRYEDEREGKVDEKNIRYMRGGVVIHLNDKRKNER